MKKHTVKAVSNRTGLSPHLIRMWERRYKAVSPQRTDTNRRIYTDEDIQRLNLLKKVTETGESIGQIASLTDDELLEILKNTSSMEFKTEPAASIIESNLTPTHFIDQAIEAVKTMDSLSLEKILITAKHHLGTLAIITDVIYPLLEEIGKLWHKGSIKITHEHMATGTVRTVLGTMLTQFQPVENAPAIVITTPIRQAHELGALSAAVMAASDGWKVLYLGPNTPADEIISAALESKARAVALSIIYPVDDPYIHEELLRLHKYLPEQVPILVGGQGTAGYQDTIKSINAVISKDLQDFKHRLELIRY